MCPDQESNRRPFGLGDNAQPTEPHWLEPSTYYFQKSCKDRAPRTVNLQALSWQLNQNLRMRGDVRILLITIAFKYVNILKSKFLQSQRVPIYKLLEVSW